MGDGAYYCGALSATAPYKGLCVSPCSRSADLCVATRTHTHAALPLPLPCSPGGRRIDTRVRSNVLCEAHNDVGFITLDACASTAGVLTATRTRYLSDCHSNTASVDVHHIDRSRVRIACGQASRRCVAPTVCMYVLRRLEPASSCRTAAERPA